MHSFRIILSHVSYTLLLLTFIARKSASDIAKFAIYISTSTSPWLCCCHVTLCPPLPMPNPFQLGLNVKFSCVWQNSQVCTLPIQFWLALTLWIRFMLRQAKLNRLGLGLGVALLLYSRRSYNRLSLSAHMTSLATFVRSNTTTRKLRIIIDILYIIIIFYILYVYYYYQLYNKLYLF